MDDVGDRDCKYTDGEDDSNEDVDQKTTTTWITLVQTRYSWMAWIIMDIRVVPRAAAVVAGYCLSTGKATEVVFESCTFLWEYRALPQAWCLETQKSMITSAIIYSMFPDTLKPLYIGIVQVKHTPSQTSNVTSYERKFAFSRSRFHSGWSGFLVWIFEGGGRVVEARMTQSGVVNIVIYWRQTCTMSRKSSMNLPPTCVRYLHMSRRSAVSTKTHEKVWISDNS